MTRLCQMRNRAIISGDSASGDAGFCCVRSRSRECDRAEECQRGWHQLVHIKGSMPISNDSYWKNLTITDADIERLYGSVLDQGEPVTANELVTTLIHARVREEQERLARYSQHARLYQPKQDYEVGERLIFPALQDAEGLVTSIRPSDNPRVPPFHVITVRFESEGSTRDFAVSYSAPHPLNKDREANADTTDLTPEQVLAEHGDAVTALLIARLRRDKEFVELGGRWLLRGLLVRVHEGYLNLAEAAIEQAGTGLATAELAQVLELPAGGVKRSSVLFSLEYALRHDDRFENVGPRGETRWFLTRLEPVEARELPRVLIMPPTGAGRIILPQDLEHFVEELEREGEPDGDRHMALPITTLSLTYPHRRAGSLPLVGKVRPLFSESDNPRMLITLVDVMTGAKMTGWLIREGNYLAGLKGWYDKHKLNPGAYVQLQKRPEPLTASIEYQPQRERSLWVRVARAQGGQLTFAQEKRAVAHKYDEEMLIVIGDPAGIDALQASTRPDRPLETLLVEVFPELAKLSGAGRVHAKTLYAAVNFIRRVGMRAVFSALVQSSAFVSLGGGYFVMETARDLVR